MCIIRVDDSLKIDLVNAKIAKAYEEYEFEGEGCLSFPDSYVKTRRYKEIVIEENLVWPYRFILTDFAAVVAQHELDHLNGILLPDVAIE